MLRYLVLVLTLSVGTVNAGLLQDSLDYVKEAELSLLYGGVSHHWVSKDFTNSTHNMVGIRINNIVVGRFKNSFNRETIFAGVYGEFDKQDFTFFGSVGAMRGYTRCYGEEGYGSKAVWCPMATVGVSYNGFSEYIQPALYQLGDATVAGIKSDF